MFAERKGFNVLTSDPSFQGFEEKMMLTCQQIKEAVPPTAEYAKGSPEKIGHAVSTIHMVEFEFDYLLTFSLTICAI